MQCLQVTILDDINILEEMVETFRVTLTAMEPFVIIQPQQESIMINIFEDPLDGWLNTVLTIHANTWTIIIINLIIQTYIYTHCPSIQK